MERDGFWTIFPFFEPLFYMTFITINPVSIFNRCMGPFFGSIFKYVPRFLYFFTFLGGYPPESGGSFLDYAA